MTASFGRIAPLLALTSIAAAVACSGTSPDVGPSGSPNPGTSPTGTTTSTSTTPGPTPPPGANDGGAPRDAGTSPPPPPPPPPGDGGDGTPTRDACTGSFGSALTSAHARLDGYLVSIVPPGGSHTCNGDSTHVHLQVLMNGAVYDVAANVDGNETEIDHALVDGAWAEGWHASDALDYPSALGVHASQFTLSGIGTVANEVEQQLANANHVSVFCTGYGPDGCHLVHRESGHDGAIVIEPLSPTPHWLLFDFSGDSF